MRTSTRLRIHSLLSIFIGAAAIAQEGATAAVATLIYGPTEAKNNVNGNAAFAPFDLDIPGRFQQVYSSSTFDVLTGVAGGAIREITFRVDASIGSPFEAIIPSLQLNLSTTPRAPDALSSVFDENVGLDDTVAINPSEISEASNGGGGFSFFDITFNLTTPFYYNPADGNLLLDFRIYRGIENVLPVAILDGFDVVGDSVSSVYAYGPTMPSSGQVSSLGLATLFAITPVPEPSTVALLAFSLGALTLNWLKKRKG